MGKINLDALKGNNDLIAQAEAAVADMGGVNFAEGAARFANKKDKFANSLYKFSQTADDGLDKDFAESVKPENDEEIRRIVHTLKGTAGNLAAMDIHYAAVDFEKSIKEGSPDEGLFDRLKEAVASLKSGMDRRFCREDTVAAAPSGVDVKGLLTELAAWLDMSEAGKCDAIIGKIKGAKVPGIDEIARLVDDYDYDTAADAARALAARL